MSRMLQPLTLPNGTVIPNRLAKAAMEENLADAQHAPGERLCRLYQQWAEGGAGLIITGNVMVDPRALTGPGGVVLESDRHLQQFKAWAAAAQNRGAQAWMQLNHPGRQMFASLGQTAVAPSAVALDMPGLNKLFAPVKALTAAEIEALLARFVRAACLAEQAGFSGVQIHAAHGYLLSQFLSPLSNRRTDEWGGDLANRARPLLDILTRVRASVAKTFSVAVKLNSADFQRGGFTVDDAVAVVQMLNPLGVDLVELSGGSYESPAMQGVTREGSTLAREAYFLEFAEQVAAVATMPLMVTGGVRRRAVAERVLEGPVAMVGMATALAMNPGLPKAWQAGQDVEVAPIVVGWKKKSLAAAATQALAKEQLARLSNGKLGDPDASPLRALLANQLKTRWQARNYRRWVKQQALQA